MIKLNVTFNKPIQPFGAPAVQAVVSALDKALKPAEVTINIKVTDAKTLHQLNKKYAGKDETTDVLSFNYQEGTKLAGERSGDVVISYNHVQSQAKAAGTDEATELALLALHGSLHVLGHNHQNSTQQGQINKLQAKVMKAAGLKYRSFGWQS